MLVALPLRQPTSLTPVAAERTSLSTVMGEVQQPAPGGRGLRAGSSGSWVFPTAQETVHIGHPKARNSIETVRSSNTPGQPRPSVELRLRPSTSVALNELLRSSYVENRNLKRLHVVGHGAFAQVEKAELTQENNKRIVAVKQLLPDILSEVELNNFIEEAKSLSKLHHKNVIEFIGIGCKDRSNMGRVAETLYIVQDYLQGGTLKHTVMQQMLINPRPLYTLCDAMRWMLGVAEGLAYLHHCKPMIIHRDLKLENILLKVLPGQDLHTAEAVIADFGLMRYFDHTEAKRKEASVHGASAHGGPNPSMSHPREHHWDGPMEMHDWDKDQSMKTTVIDPSTHPQRLIVTPPARAAFMEDSARMEQDPSTAHFLDLMRQSTLNRPDLTPVSSGRPHSTGPAPMAESSGHGGTQGLEEQEDRSVMGRFRRTLTFHAPLQPNPSSLGGTVTAAGAAKKLKDRQGAKATFMNLTGLTGSLMYMAPEVYHEKPYNQMVDVFSFAMVMFEVFHRDITESHLFLGMSEEQDQAHLDQYAEKVAGGYRPDFTINLPAALVSLIRDCWSQNPSNRPSMRNVVERLKMIQSSKLLEELDAAKAKQSVVCGCF